MKRYYDASVKVSEGRKLKDIARDMSGKDVSKTFNLQGMVDYGNGAILGETFNQGLRSRRAGITSQKAHYNERKRRAAEYRKAARKAYARDDRYSDLEMQYFTNAANDIQDGTPYWMTRIRNDLETFATIHEFYLYSK